MGDMGAGRMEPGKRAVGDGKSFPTTSGGGPGFPVSE